MADPITESARQPFVFRNAFKQIGFAKLSHAIGLDDRLSDGAYRTLSIYLRYAHQNPSCWPSIRTIAKDRNKATCTIALHNKELETLGYITRERRTGKTTLTVIEDVEEIPHLQDIVTKQLKGRKDSALHIQLSQRYTSSYLDAEEESLKKDDVTEYESPSETLAPAGRTFFEAQGQEPKPSETEPVPEKKSERSRPRVVSHRQSTPHSTMFSALRVAFRFPSKMTPSQAGRLNKLAKLVLENEYTIAQVKEAGSQWWTSWPGNLGGSNIPKNDQFLERLEQLRVAQSKRRKV